MSYCTIEDITDLTGLKPKHWFKNSETPDEDFKEMMDKWIQMASDAVDKYCNRTFDELTDTTSPPGTIRLATSLLVSNLIAFAQTRRDTPIIKHNDWNVDFLSVDFFTDDIKDMLEDYKVSKVNSSKIDFFTVYGDDD